MQFCLKHIIIIIIIGLIAFMNPELSNSISQNYVTKYKKYASLYINLAPEAAKRSKGV